MGFRSGVPYGARRRIQKELLKKLTCVKVCLDPVRDRMRTRVVLRDRLRDTACGPKTLGHADKQIGDIVLKLVAMCKGV